MTKPNDYDVEYRVHQVPIIRYIVERTYNSKPDESGLSFVTAEHYGEFTTMERAKEVADRLAAATGGKVAMYDEKIPPA